MPGLAVSRRVVRHHGSEDNTLGPDDCKAHALGPVANTDTKLLIYGLFHEGRVLAHNGVSTRNYESSLDKPAAKLKSRGTSKSAASRHLVSQTTKKLEEYLSRRLEEFELAALMLDGLEVAGQTVVVTLGITIDGTKVPLGIWLGSTENSRVCTAMLQDLLERSLRVDESILCVVDGGKGIRKALVDVLGDLAVIQRCQIHKLRNLRSYLPKSRHAYVLQTMKEAYKVQECRQGAQATSGIGVVARAKRLRRSCRKPS